MPKSELKPSNFFNPDTQLAALCLIACPGAEELAKKIDKHLVQWAQEVGMKKDVLPATSLICEAILVAI